jgi:4-hydroxybenzoate polyprenyltransferase
LHVLLSFIGVFLGLFLAYSTRKESYVILYIAVPAILWAYSTTFKKQVLIGNFIIAFLTALVPFLVVSLEFAVLARQHGTQILTSEACNMAWFWTNGFAFFAFITTLTREIIKDMEDLNGDKAIGCKTLPVEIGLSYSKIIIHVLIFGSISALWIIYATLDILKEIPYTYLYFTIFLTLPFMYQSFVTQRAMEPQDFHKASSIGKWIMLSGILFILLASLHFAQ